MLWEGKTLLKRQKTEHKTNKKDIDMASIIKKYGLVMAFVVIFTILSLTSGTFFTTTNLMNVVRQISINGIIALGMTFVILTGGIDLSVGSLVAVAGVIAGSIINVNPNLAWPAFFAGVMACGVFGFITGAMIVKFDIPPFVATLAMMTIAKGFALVYSNGRLIYMLGMECI